jgi:phospholipase/carboxylesterase
MSPHDQQHVLRGGAPLARARAALILLHGRGASAEDIFSLGEAASAKVPAVALLAPQASGNAWYPKRFLAPLAENEPYLSSALAAVGRLVDEAKAAAIPLEKILLAGFSQGACLALEFACRNPRRYGGVAGLSGALIGPPGGRGEPSGNLGGTPVYLACDDDDPHIPLASVVESARVFRAMGADVTESIFTGLGHTVGAEELSVLRGLVRAAAA